ncbi:tyrosine recombinase XerC [Deinococcus marmoris]|uniref:site-specific integrase n=1 Tax=Deinococcus marmoris TaxID=249408 RepID=UPI000495E4DC|nr:tyrosine-type recombinase/integrase [Deinococcus marmoris]
MPPAGWKNRNAAPKTRGKEKYITERQDGRFAVTIENGKFDADKGRHVAFQSTYRTLEDACKARNKVLHDRDRGIVVIRDSTTVRELLVDWGRRRRDAGAEHSTVENHAWLTELISGAFDVAPLVQFGNRQVQKLEVQHVEAMLGSLRQAGYKPSTRAKAFRQLRSAVEEAVQRGLLPRNPVRGVRAPVVAASAPRTTWTPEELTRLHAAVKESRMSAFFILLMATGTRVGELVGACLEDYDPASGVLRITGTAKKGGGRGKPKTEHALRELPLPPAVCQILADHLVAVSRARAAAGPLWGQRKTVKDEAETRALQRQASTRRYAAGWVPAPPAPEPYAPMFPTGNGTPFLVRNVQREWSEILKRAGLPHRPLHETRAAWITAVLGELKVHEVQRAAGHSTPEMTLHYARNVEGRQTRAAFIGAERLGLVDSQEEGGESVS